MARAEVHVHDQCPVSADAVWDAVREFSAKWHPFVESIEGQRGANGQQIRRFKIRGEAAVFREELIYYSHSDRVMSYRHLEGIAGAKHYTATFSVVPLETGCRINWTAEIEADECRLQQIADGTRKVFEVGVESLRNAKPDGESSGPAGGVKHPGSTSAKKFRMADVPVTACQVPPKPLNCRQLCLFLHGIGGNRHNWHVQVAVAGELMRASAMNLRGYGGGALGGAPSTVDDYCDDVLHMMTKCGADRLVLCGLSYGAWIATSFAMRHPEKLAGLVLAGGCTGMSEASPEERERFRLSREVPLNAGKMPKDFALDVVDAIVSPNASQEVRRELFGSMAAIPTATYRDALQCFTQPKERFDFSKMNMPVLFVTGEHDTLASPNEIRGVAERVRAEAHSPNVRFEIVPGAGHVCNLENPAAFNNLLKSFLSELVH